MENNFDQDGFEDFLRNNTRNHRMYPNDRVWRRINNQLHSDKRWPGLTLAALLLLAVTTVICFHFSPQPNIFSLNPIVEPQQSGKMASSAKTNVLDKLTTASAFTRQSYNSPNTITNINPVAPVGTSNTLFDDNTYVIEEGYRSRNDLVYHEKHGISIQGNAGHIEDESGNPSILEPSDNPFAEAFETKAVENPTNQEKITVSQELDIKKTDQKTDTKTQDENVAYNTLPVPKASRPAKFSIQVYAAPSISYRKLFEDKSIIKSPGEGPVELNQVADVNDVVRHKPAVGLEAGVNVLYEVSRKFRIKSGLQFNVRQYSIDAYKSYSELASIALVQNNRIDTINTYAVFRNFNGNSSTQLQNKYYQISMPLGVEWEVIGNKKIQLNVAAAIQPTFLVNRNAYLLSTNFKNYTENEEMVRKWNLNSNLEAFVSFVVGDFKWQVGPQIRYQPYSTFIAQYPIKEYLIDYGFKVAVSTKLK